MSLRTQLSLSLLVLSGICCFAEEPPAATVSNDATGFWSRHLQILELEQITRFNYMDSESHEILGRDLQYRIRTGVQINLTDSGSTYIRFRAETGQGFDNSWNNTGAGLSRGQADFFMKTLTLGQKFGSHFEMQAGGIEFDQGAGTHHSYASEDGYLTGYRAMVSGVRSRFGIDKLVTTVGYVGDFDSANVFPRLQKDLGQMNYVQILGSRNFGERAEASAEFDSIRGIRYTREAVNFRKPFGPAVDEFLVESIVRTSNRPTFGAAASISRTLDTAKRLHAFAIYSQLPTRLLLKNDEPILFPQGEISRGKRLSIGTNYDITSHFFVGLFGGRLLDSTPTLRYVAQISIGYDYTSLANRMIRSLSN